jgi:transaldolase
MSSRLHQLSALGQSVWIDYLSRDLIESGALARAVDEDAVVGVTSNPSIFQKALSHGHAYDEQIGASTEGDAESVFLSLALHDVAAACDLLRPVWERTEAHDGYVSIEVEPTLAADTKATIAQATRFHEAISRPNLLVKIPATDAGVPAIEEMTAHGYSINVTLIFSLRRHREIADAYQRGLERFIAVGGDPSRVHSVASFFVSRVDSETDRRLAAVGRDDLEGRLGIANAKLAYQQYKQLFTGDRWEALAARGATTQRCLWASTSTKDPSLHDTLYVEELIGPETISTMPAETIQAFQITAVSRRGSRATSMRRNTCSTSCTPPESTTRTWSPSLSARGSRSSSPPSPSFCRASPTSVGSWRPREPIRADRHRRRPDLGPSDQGAPRSWRRWQDRARLGGLDDPVPSTAAVQALPARRGRARGHAR